MTKLLLGKAVDRGKGHALDTTTAAGKAVGSHHCLLASNRRHPKQ
jgi:hypothetical protein